MKAWLLTQGPIFRRRALLALISLTPLLFLRSANDPINVPKLGLLIAGVALVAGVRAAELLQGAERTSLQRLVVPAGALGTALIIGWAASAYRGWALFGGYGRFQGLLPYLVVILFGVLVADAFSRDTVQGVLWAMAVAGALVGLYAVIQVLGADPLEWSLQGLTSQATSTLGNPNFTGAYLAIALCACAGLWFLDPGRRAWLAGASVFVAAGWLAAESQGAWAAGLAGLSFVLIPRVLSVPRARLLGGIMAVVVAAVALGAIAYGVVKQPAVGASPGSIALRSYAWKAGAGVIADSPIVGSGPNTYALLGVSHRSPADAVGLTGEFPDDPHSVFLSWGVAAGIFGLAAFVIIAGWAANRIARTDSDDVLVATLGACLIAYLVQSLASIDELSLRVTAWALLGALATSTLRVPENAGDEERVPSKRARKKKAREPLRWAPALVVIAAVVLGAAWWSASFVLADARFHWGMGEVRSGATDQGLEHIRSASSFRDDTYYRWRSGELIGEAAVELDDPGLFEIARASFAYLESFPDIHGLVSYGRLLDGWARNHPETQADALLVYERAVELDPLNPLLRVELADVLVDLDRPQEAVDILAPAIEIGGDRYAEVWGALAVARANLGQVAAAREAVERAFALDPTEPQAVAVDDALDAGDS